MNISFAMVSRAARGSRRPGQRQSYYASLAGEFFVLAELAYRKIDGTLTLGHAKEIDILVLNRRTKQTFRVEVKTASRGPHRGKYFGENYEWFMHARHESEEDQDLIYCFVLLGEQPRYRVFVVPAAEVAAYVRWEHAYYVERVKGQDNLLRKFRIPAGSRKSFHHPGFKGIGDFTRATGPSLT